MSMELPILDITNVQRISILSQRSIDFVAKGKLYQYIGQNRDRCTVMVAPEAFVERVKVFVKKESKFLLNISFENIDCNAVSL